MEQHKEGLIDFMFVTSFFGKLKGLLFSKQPGRIIVLTHCRSIHTFGMVNEIDVAFIDQKGRVLASETRVKPRTRIKKRGAVAVVERLSCSEAPWLREGEKLYLSGGNVLTGKNKERK